MKDTKDLRSWLVAQQHISESSAAQYGPHPRAAGQDFWAHPADTDKDAYSFHRAQAQAFAMAVAEIDGTDNVTVNGTRATMVLHHDDPPCNARLAPDGLCRECGVYPDMQSTCIYYYCPTCDCRLFKWHCPKCGSDVQPPVGYKGR